MSFFAFRLFFYYFFQGVLLLYHYQNYFQSLWDNYQSNLEVWDRYGPWKSTPGGSFFFLETNVGRALLLRLEDDGKFELFIKRCLFVLELFVQVSMNKVGIQIPRIVNNPNWCFLTHFYGFEPFI